MEIATMVQAAGAALKKDLKLAGCPEVWDLG